MTSPIVPITSPARGTSILLRWVARLLLVVFTITMSVAGLEWTLRTFGPVLPGNYSAHLYLEPHSIYGRFHTPGTIGWIRTSEYMTRVEINSQGLRERELAYLKPAGMRRVVVLGDSFVEGAEVAVTDTLPRQLESYLNTTGEDQTEVINAGVRAFSTGQEFLLLQHEMVRHQPDLVVLVFYGGNDVANNSARIEHNLTGARKPYFALGRDGRLRALSFSPKKQKDEGIVERLRRESLVFAFLDTGILARFATAPNDESAGNEDESDGREQPDRQFVKTEMPVFAADVSPEWEDAWAITEALLAATRDQAEQAGAAFLLVYAPTRWEIYQDDWQEILARNRLPDEGWDLDTPGRRVTEIAARRGISLLNLSTALRDQAAGQRLYFQQDVHWMARGHQVAAQTVGARILEQGILDSPNVGLRLLRTTIGDLAAEVGDGGE
ncbi:MAG: alginate O-acetyltransferase AlgX-related protein [Chloroflexota bacterium]